MKLLKYKHPVQDKNLKKLSNEILSYKNLSYRNSKVEFR